MAFTNSISNSSPNSDIDLDAGEVLVIFAKKIQEHEDLVRDLQTENAELAAKLDRTEAKLNELAKKAEHTAKFLVGDGEGSVAVQILALMVQQGQQAEKIALLAEKLALQEAARPDSTNKKSKGKKSRRG